MRTHTHVQTSFERCSVRAVKPLASQKSAAPVSVYDASKSRAPVRIRWRMSVRGRRLQSGELRKKQRARR